MKKRTVKANANRRKAGSKKGMDQALWWVLDVILVLLSLALFAAIMGSLEPDKQIAILNTELLRSKMNEACLNGRSTMDKFNLQQPKPNNMLGAFDVLPRFAINTGGDPQYVLYYEAFPPGEAIGWEFYHNFPDRFVGTFDARNYHELQGKLVTVGSSITGNDVDTFIRLMKNHEESIRVEGSSYSEKNTLVSNVILNPYMNVIPTEDAKPAVELMKGVNDTGNLGAPSEANRDFFEFSSYVSLSKQDQTYIKYRPCGPYSLCLKTREGVYSFPLEQCRSAGIQYVQLVYDARDIDLGKIIPGGAIAGAGTATVIKPGFRNVLTSAAKFICTKPPWGTLVCAVAGGALSVLGLRSAGEVLSFSLRYKVSDFYIASPCSITNDPRTIEITRLNDCGGMTPPTCKHFIKYPVYAYEAIGGQKSITYMNDHYTCVDSIDDIDTQDRIPQLAGETKCLRVKITSVKNDYCWTKNPYLARNTGADQSLRDFWERIKFITGIDILFPGDDTVKSDVTQLMQKIGNLPVKDTTNYLSNTKSIVLKSTTVGEGLFEKSRSVVGNTFELTWAWPG